MSTLTSLQTLWANKYVRGALVSLAVLAAGLFYRNHLIDYGAAQERSASQARQAVAVAQAKESDAEVTAAITADLHRQIQTQQENHDRITSELQAALADSDLRRRAADERIVRLLNAAAAVRPGTPAPTGGTRGTPGTPARNPAHPARSSVVASDADVFLSVDENYAICTRNAARLSAIQAWYEALRAGRSATPD